MLVQQGGAGAESDREDTEADDVQSGGRSIMCILVSKGAQRAMWQLFDLFDQGNLDLPQVRAYSTSMKDATRMRLPTKSMGRTLFSKLVRDYRVSVRHGKGDSTW